MQSMCSEHYIIGMDFIQMLTTSSYNCCIILCFLVRIGWTFPLKMSLTSTFVTASIPHGSPWNWILSRRALAFWSLPWHHCWRITWTIVHFIHSVPLPNRSMMAVLQMTWIYLKLWDCKRKKTQIKALRMIQSETVCWWVIMSLLSTVVVSKQASWQQFKQLRASINILFLLWCSWDGLGVCSAEEDSDSRPNRSELAGGMVKTCCQFLHRSCPWCLDD